MDQLRLVFMLSSLAELGDSVPQPPWDFSLWSLKRQGHAGLAWPARPAVYKAPNGARVASPQSPILR
jgi:hypothetical protein